MAIYFVTGKLGSGKTLCAVGRIQEYLQEGRRVATNLDLNLDKMLSPRSKQTVTRIPDKPRVTDFEMLGRGHDEDGPNEEKNGLIVLDECLDFLDSRGWRDKERAPVLSWFRHARKLRWDIFFLLQDVESADGQMVRQLCEHLVTCRRMDRVKLAGFKLPKAHIAQVRYGSTASAPAVERWMYRGTDLYAAYDTEQCFSDQHELMEFSNGFDQVDMRAPYTYLSPWHTEGRYLEPEPVKRSFWQSLFIYGVAYPAHVIYYVGMFVLGRKKHAPSA